MKKFAIILVLAFLCAAPAFAAWPDNEQLGVKLQVAGVAYAAYWAAPSATPTPQQLALAKEYVNGLGVANRYLTIMAQLNGFTDATPYATVKAWVDAREAEVIKLFNIGGAQQ